MDKFTKGLARLVSFVLIGCAMFLVGYFATDVPNLWVVFAIFGIVLAITLPFLLADGFTD